MSDNYDETLEALADKLNKLSDKISLTPVLDKLLNIDDHLLDLQKNISGYGDNVDAMDDILENLLKESKFKMADVLKAIETLHFSIDDETKEKLNSLKRTSETTLQAITNDKTNNDLQRLILGNSNTLEYQTKLLKELNYSEKIEKIIEKNIILENILNNIYNFLNNNLNKNNFNENNEKYFKNILNILNNLNNKKENNNEELIRNYYNNILNALNKNNNEDLSNNFISIKTALDKIGYAVNNNSIENAILDKVNVLDSSIKRLDVSDKYGEELLKNFISLKSVVDRIAATVNDSTFEVGILEKLNLMDSTMKELSKNVAHADDEKLNHLIEKYDTIKPTLDNISIAVKDKSLSEQISTIESSLANMNSSFKEVIRQANNDKIYDILNIINDNIAESGVDVDSIVDDFTTVEHMLDDNRNVIDKILYSLSQIDLEKFNKSNSDHYAGIKNAIVALNNSMFDFNTNAIENQLDVDKTMRIVKDKQTSLEQQVVELKEDFYNLNAKIDNNTNLLLNILNSFDNVYEKLLVIETNLTSIDYEESEEGYTSTDYEEYEEDDYSDRLDALEEKINSLENAINRLLESYMNNVGEG